jgi:hypothetical protein
VPLICTPGNRNTAIKMATAVISVFDKKDIIVYIILPKVRKTLRDLNIFLLIPVILQQIRF